LGDRVDYILDGGPSAVGVESTVLDLCSVRPRILRPGGVSREDLEALIGPVLAADGGAAAVPRSPGQLTSHYAPRTALSVHRRAELIALPYRAGEARLFFDAASRDAWLEAGAPPSIPEGRVRCLSEGGNLAEAAARLFDLLHEMDGMGVFRIRAELAPDEGLGPAINDRLLRAAAAGNSGNR
jgi:L-threonylcarbamoyladenylate synthase